MDLLFAYGGCVITDGSGTVLWKSRSYGTLDELIANRNKIKHDMWDAEG